MEHQTLLASPSASEIWKNARDDKDFFSNPSQSAQIVSSLQIDDKLAAINIGIVLREQNQFRSANLVFEKILSLDPVNVHAHYNYSHSLLRYDRHAQALIHARRAAGLQPEVLRFVLHYATILADAGDAQRAKNVLNQYIPQNLSEKHEISAVTQFVKYLQRYPRSMIEATICETASSQAYCEDDAVAKAILHAISAIGLSRLFDLATERAPGHSWAMWMRLSIRTSIG